MGCRLRGRVRYRDFTFYVFLKLLLDWPASLFTWDILFLDPGAMGADLFLAPILVSAAMIAAGVWHLRSEARTEPIRIGLKNCAGLLAGAAIIVLTFAMDYQNIMAAGMPRPFHWGVFGLEC